MARQATDDIQQQVQQQNDDNYQEDAAPGTSGGTGPVVIDDAMEEVTGEEPHLDEAANIARKIDEDEEDVVTGAAPIGSDVPEEEEE